MKQVTICKFYFQGTFVGEAPIPDFSTATIRRAIAKHLGIKQYDEVELNVINLDKNVLSSLRISLLPQTMPLSGVDLASYKNQSKEEYMAEVAKEAEPISDN